MPQDEPNSSLMSDKVDNWLVEVTVESDVRNLPDLDGAVLAGTRYDVVVVWTPLNVEYSGAVSSH